VAATPVENGGKVAIAARQISATSKDGGRPCCQTRHNGGGFFFTVSTQKQFATITRGWYYKLYSVIAIMLYYVSTSLHNALYLWRIVIASDSYCFRLFADIITYDSSRSELAGQHYRFTSLSFSVTCANVIAS
jgi:hypothetical protein